MMRNNKKQVADVYKEETFVGKITRTTNGSVFEYDESCKDCIAFNLPLTKKRYETFGVNLHTFFAGLLPEGLRLESLTKKIKTSKDDLLSILIAAGADCIGDISVVPENEKPKELLPDVDVKDIAEVSFEELFRKSISYESTDEITIPGVQDKISANLISLPVKTKAKNKTYILKLNPPDKQKLVENEYFFLGLAKTLEIPTANAELVTDCKDKQGLLVERFDRIFLPTENRLKKIHQEDACQFLDRYPADKYTQITCRMIAEGIENFCSAPIIEIAKFIRLLIFSYIIGNGDLHAKNVSIYKSPANGRIELTPAYDLLSTIPYGDNRMALKLEGRDDNLKRNDFLKFGSRHGVREIVIESQLDELCEGILKQVQDVEKIGLTSKSTKHLIAIIIKRCNDLCD